MSERMDSNLLLEVLQWLEMEPLGVTTGVIGSTLSLFVVNGNTFTWRRTILILFAGVGLCGYTLTIAGVLSARVFDGPEAVRSASLVLNILIGFIASDALSSVKTAAPTLTNLIVNYLVNFLKKFWPEQQKKNE